MAKSETTQQAWLPETKLEAKVVDAIQNRASKGSSMRSFDSIVLKFPKIDESFRNCKATFEQFDEDSNGAIDKEEMKRCFHKLEISFTEDEINDLFEACDINEDMRINFNEFIVFLCLVYLLKDDRAGLHTNLKEGMPNLQATIETLVDTFVFLDKNKDGYVSKSEIIQAINGRIAMRRFDEMDWDKNGIVNFREFLFAFTRWVGIDEEEEDND